MEPMLIPFVVVRNPDVEMVVSTGCHAEEHGDSKTANYSF